MSSTATVKQVDAGKGKPWYREPWPFLLAAGPLLVVIAGTVTAVIAFRSADGVVAEDYYKRGLAINQTLARTDKARDLGMAALVSYNNDTGRIRINLSGQSLPDTLTIRLAHPVKATEDKTLIITSESRGIYEADLKLDTQTVRWDMIIETPDWRLSGRWLNPQQQSLTLSSS